jgi:(p)ppGpp synthase/HD superfamily hydrolase
MNEIAEKGYAAHWKYKEKNSIESGLDRWLNKIKELLQSPDSNALTFLDDFKLNLFADEIIVFTPKGQEKTLAFRFNCPRFCIQHTLRNRQPLHWCQSKPQAW